MKIRIITLLCVLALLFCCGCVQSTEKDGVSVLASTFPAYDFARAVCGEDAQMDMLIPAGTEIHSFEPSPTDILKIENADIFIYTGGESDVWADKILASVEDKDKTVIRLTENATLLCEDDGDEFDEHVWLSPDNAIHAIHAICNALCLKDSENGENYTSRTERYCKKIKAAEDATREVVKGAKNPTVVIADRFPYRYFCNYYGITAVAAFDACDRFTDADVATVTRLLNAVRDNNIKYVYRTEEGKSAIAQTVCRETGAETLTLYSLHTLPRDEFLKGKTYVDYMYENLNALKRGLISAAD